MEDSWIEHVKESASKNVDEIIRSIRTGEYTKIVFLVGAGISVAAGYPLFRGEGVDTPSALSSESLPHEIGRALIPFVFDNGSEIESEPTDFHKMMHKYAHRIYTQNIDGLEQDDGRTVWCHGKLRDGATCKSCGELMPWSEYKHAIYMHNFQCKHCEGDIYPNITLYGNQVKFDFYQAEFDVYNADLVICAGTSLEVYPFANLLGNVPGKLLIVERRITQNHSLHLSGPNRHLYSGDCQEFARICGY